MKITTFALAACLFSVCSYAEVVRVEVTARQDIPQYGYEQITGKVHFSLDPHLRTWVRQTEIYEHALTDRKRDLRAGYIGVTV